MRWANAIQGAIDSKVPIETPTQQLIRDIKVGPKILYSPSDTSKYKTVLLIFFVVF